MKIHRFWKRAVAGIATLLAGIQFVPLGGAKLKSGTSTAQAVSMAETIDPRVGAILDRACRDCHSKQTRWPWYGNIAPVSWLLSRDAQRGRAMLDFSNWSQGSHSANERAEVCDAVSDGSMPSRAYVLFHPNAKLSEADVNLICSWASIGGEGSKTFAAPGDRQNIPGYSSIEKMKGQVH